MNDGRRARGFESLGRLRPTEVGLRRRDARRLLLAHTWRRVAGEVVARRLSAKAVLRGTLEIEGEPRWAEDLGPLLPRLVGRVASLAPELGIRRFRVRTPEQRELPPARAIEPEPGAGPPAEPGPAGEIDEVPAPGRSDRGGDRPSSR